MPEPTSVIQLPPGDHIINGERVTVPHDPENPRADLVNFAIPAGLHIVDGKNVVAPILSGFARTFGEGEYARCAKCGVVIVGTPSEVNTASKIVHRHRCGVVEQGPPSKLVPIIAG